MTKTLEEWSATMHRIPQMGDALADIAKDFKLKLPDRSYLFMYNSTPMENFRKMGALDAVAKKQQDHRILQEEVLEQAREGGNVPDIAHVTSAAAKQVNMTDALRQQMEGLSATTRQEQEGRRVEMQQEMERLAAVRRAEEERARIAREVSQVHLDGMAADIDRIREASAAAGVVNNNVTHQYDQRVTNVVNNSDQRVINTQNVMEHNTHATMMNFMAHHQAQLAASPCSRASPTSEPWRCRPNT